MESNVTYKWGIYSFVSAILGILSIFGSIIFFLISFIQPFVGDNASVSYFISQMVPFIGLILSIIAIVFFKKQWDEMPSRLGMAGLLLGILGILLNGFIIRVIMFPSV